MQSSKGLGNATIALFWLVTLFGFLLAFSLFRRKSVVEDFFSNGSFDDIQKVNDADSLVGAMALLQILVQIAAAIVVCLWSKRIASNAIARGGRDISPGLAAGGWFIPIGWFFVPFNQLRKSVKAVGGQGSGSGITGWQIAWVISGVSGFAVFTYRGDIDMADSETSLSDALSRQATIGIVGAVLTGICAFMAMRGIREANRVVTGDS